MKRIISPLLVAVVAIVSYAQIDPSTMTYDQLYMKMKTDEVLRTMYEDACTDISKNIELQDKIKELTAPINSEYTKELTKIADSLGVKVDDGAGTPEQHKFYNPKADTAAVIKFLGLRQSIDQKYWPLIASATEGLQTQYRQMVQAAFTEAATRYYENLNKMTKK